MPGPTELLIILAIVLVIFGSKRLVNMGKDLGGAIKGFRSAMTDKEKAAEAEAEGERAREDADSDREKNV